MSYFITAIIAFSLGALFASALQALKKDEEEVVEAFIQLKNSHPIK